MPNYKVVDAEQLDAAMTATADAIRAKGGTAEPIPWDELTGFSDAVGAIVAGSPESVSPKDVNFYDYDGTILYSYTVEEAATLTELPPLPSHDGLICQGWNWTLDDIKAMERAVEVGAMYITDDGKTRIYITLSEGRTSPMLGCCPNGTVTVDWGDGTAPDVLTGTSTTTVVWTPTHNYAVAGDYVITLTVNGSMGIAGTYDATYLSSCLLRHTPAIDKRNSVYQSAVRRVNVGAGVVSFAAGAFGECQALKTITVPNTITGIESYAFINCRTLQSIVVPLGITMLGGAVFGYDYALESIAIPKSVISMNTSVWSDCYRLERLCLSDEITEIKSNLFSECKSLKHVHIPERAEEIGNAAFSGCMSITKIVVPPGVLYIDARAFSNCSGMRLYDFSRHTEIPYIDNTNVFTNIPADCEIHVPASLAEEWKADTNWATYADYIVGV